MLIGDIYYYTLTGGLLQRDAGFDSDTPCSAMRVDKNRVACWSCKNWGNDVANEIEAGSTVEAAAAKAGITVAQWVAACDANHGAATFAADARRKAARPLADEPMPDIFAGRGQAYECDDIRRRPRQIGC